MSTYMCMHMYMCMIISCTARGRETEDHRFRARFHTTQDIYEIISEIVSEIVSESASKIIISYIDTFVVREVRTPPLRVETTPPRPPWGAGLPKSPDRQVADVRRNGAFQKKTALL